MPQVHLFFETTLGDFDGEFASDQPISAIKREVMAGVRLDPNEADQFVINQNEQPLDDSKTIADLGLQTNDWLTVGRR